jgi:hypothetical protein
MVALVVGAVVILGARALLDGLSLHAGRVHALARSADAEANAEHALRSAVLRAGLSSDSAARFDGTAEHARFASWCDVAGGWEEQCEVRIAVERDDASARLRVTLTLGDGGDVRVARDLDAASLRYLASAADGGHWVERWERSIASPLAIALITRPAVDGTAPPPRPDTLVLRLGERG